MRKITFKTDKNQNSFNFFEDHNDIFDHKYQTIQAIYLVFNIACCYINI